MRQTIECLKCSKGYNVGTDLETCESVSITLGNPLREYRCDGCNKALDTHHLVAAIGCWDIRIPNIPGWEKQYIRVLTPEEIAEYGVVEEAAETLRREDDNPHTSKFHW